MKGAQALVIGGGIAGLLCANMLKNRFAKVTVLERSNYVEPSDSAPATRPEVPQSHCLHMLMGAGAQAFDELVPGWRAELIARGAVAYDAGADVAMRVASGWLPRVETGITLYGASRGLIEGALLAVLREAHNVQIQTVQRVIGLEVSRDGERVCGVRLQSTKGVLQVLNNVDVVVDASGAASRLPRWLARVYGEQHQIARTEIAPGRQYVSSWVRLAPDQTLDWQGLALAPTQGHAGMMMRAENDLWGVVLQTPEDVPLPTDDETFLESVAKLPATELYDTLKRSVPVTRPHLFGRTANRRRHYEQYSFWPDNLFAIGDSVCALDPYAGLGMTAAARGVQLLQGYLDQPDQNMTNTANRFQSQLAKHNQLPWMIATNDWTTAASQTGLADQINSLIRAAPFDPALAIMLLELQHMLRTPETLTNEVVS
ncbi:FAD-dependent oxidoreductase [Ruegeria atlantica]|uniref:FAD-dependent oxidoreductase n=1 Tax=Ruegeria atlantica TaxID=81569 RepID=UPI00267048F4|nr:NAD(P)-binding protein [Ruegeria atlantica]